MSSLYTPTPSPDEIYHYGVLGMKWGVRRYQNADGSLTAAGKRRYRKMEDRAIKKERKETVRNRRNMSDEEIQQYINRLNLEKRMKDLSDEDLSPGRAIVNNAIKKSGKIVVTGAIVGALAYGGKLLISHRIPVRAVNAVVRVGKELAVDSVQTPKIAILSGELKNLGNKVFRAENLEVFEKNVDWDELARFMFPNPNKK